MNLHYTRTKFDGDVSAHREKYIGGSDAGTILGLNPFKSAYTLWLEKTGMKEVEDISDKLPVWLGTRMEEIVAERFTKESGIEVQHSNISYSVQEYPFMVGHIDRKIKGVKEGLECKTTSAWNKTSFQEGDIPPSHYAQMQFYLLVTGWSAWHYAVIRNNSEFYYAKIERNDEWIESVLLPAMVDFWDCVQTNTPPMIDGSKSTSESIDLRRNTMGLQEDGESTVLGKKIATQLAEAIEIKAQIKSLEEIAKTYENNAKVAMENYKFATAGKFDLKFDTYSRKTVDSTKLEKLYPDAYKDCIKTSSYSKFTYKERKEGK